MSSVTEDFEELRKLLRSVARTYPGDMPANLQAWWGVEQPIIAAEKAVADQRKAEKIAALEARIAELEAQLAGLL